LAIAILKKVTAGWYFVLLVTVKIVAFVSLFAVTFQVMDANNLLVLALVGLEILRFIQRNQLVEA
jgi:hypothetical protein